MADPAVLSSLVTGATAVLSGFIGYGTARGQRTLELKRIEREEEDARHTRREASRRELRELYLRYLGSIDAFGDVAVQHDGPEPGEMDDWWATFQSIDAAVEITGSEPVREASYAVYEALRDAFADLDWGAADFRKSAQEAYGEHTDRITDARKPLVDAMRADLHGDSAVHTRRERTTGR